MMTTLWYLDTFSDFGHWYPFLEKHLLALFAQGMTMLGWPGKIMCWYCSLASCWSIYSISITLCNQVNSQPRNVRWRWRGPPKALPPAANRHHAKTPWKTGKPSWFSHFSNIPKEDLYWLVVYLPLWKMMEFVSWDDEIPNWMESHKIHVWNHQPEYYAYIIFSWDFIFQPKHVWNHQSVYIGSVHKSWQVQLSVHEPFIGSFFCHAWMIGSGRAAHGTQS